MAAFGVFQAQFWKRTTDLSAAFAKSVTSRKH
ncbi:uncharacterized protein METZ01_LOCUS380448 [marine metagenome]|uniref:Uncharacterized protein n=1 Tax=marine metagenome TaxID=408172 RepID=A0A382TZV3_9ZZZZ